MELSALPDALVERILFICDVQTIANAAAVSRSLQRVASSESLWLRICQQQFTETDPRQWHHAQESGRMHQTYRSVYRLLSSHEHSIGLWRHSKAEQGLLLELYWDSDCIAGTELLYENMWTPPQKTPFSKIGPNGQVVPEPLGMKQLVIHKFAAPHVRPPSRAAESAAAVACFGSSPPSEALLGSSPASSFEQEMLRFMQSNVAGSRQGRRRSKGSPGQGGVQRRAVEVLHLERVLRPVPSRRHPMAGLWKADYGPGGVQIVLISYDFTGPAARIVGVKVTGDDHVPAGKHTWHAQAAPMKQPWSSKEAALVDMQGQLLDQRADNSEDAVAAHKRVVAIYEGKGRIAALGYAESTWVEGRLWEYSDGACGFLWLNTMFDYMLVQLERIDADIRQHPD